MPRRWKGRHRARGSARCSPISSCTTRSISGPSAGDGARHGRHGHGAVRRRPCATTARRGGSDVTRPTRSSLAAREMRAGPSDPDHRIRVQTTASCAGTTAGVVSVAEKARKTRQACAGKTNAREPLMTCRKRWNVAETRLQLLAWDEARRKPVDWPSGDRHEDGVRPARGSCAERGNRSPRRQGRSPSGRPVRRRVPMRGTGTDGSAVAMKPGNAGGAKGPNSPAEDIGQPERGGAGV